MPLEAGIESQAQGDRRTFHTKALIYMKKEQHYYPTYPLQNQGRESLELSLVFIPLKGRFSPMQIMISRLSYVVSTQLRNIKVFPQST